MTFGYNANVFKNVATTIIADHANDLLEDLVIRREGAEVGKTAELCCLSVSRALMASSPGH